MYDTDFFIRTGTQNRLFSARILGAHLAEDYALAMSLPESAAPAANGVGAQDDGAGADAVPRPVLHPVSNKKKRRTANDHLK